MSLNDFCALSPKEFSECCKAFRDQREQEIHLSYEVARWHALIAIAPHVKRKPKLTFPWDKEEKAKKQKAAVISKEESLERFKLLMKREKG